MRKSTQLEPFIIEGMADSTHASDKDTRRSVTGLTVTVNGSLCMWKSKMQDAVVLSSCEAEMVALVHCLKEMKFVRNILHSLGFKVEKPMLLWTDNTGVIDILYNHSTTGRARHTSIKLNYLRQEMDNEVTIRHVPSLKNHSDSLTKNNSAQLHNAHSAKLTFDIADG